MWKGIAAFLFGLIFVLVSVDVTSAYFTYNRLSKSLDQALDSAIVAGTQETEHQRGFVRLDEGETERAVRKALIENMKLDSAMESNRLSDSDLEVKLTYQGDVPRIEVQFSTHIKIVSGSLFGETYPAKIRKKTPFLAEFI